MAWLERKRLFIYFTILYILGYYILLYFKEDWSKTPGEAVFSIATPLISSIILFFIYKQRKTKDHSFWLFLSLGCFSLVILHIISSYYENLLQKPVPNWSVFFNLLPVVLFLTAFIDKILQSAKKLHLIKFTFDICIIMTVAITFSWRFLMEDIISQNSLTALFIPIGDLVLLFGAISFYIGREAIFPPKVLYLLLGSLFLQVIANSTALYINNTNLESLLVPLTELSLLLLGLSGIYTLGENHENTAKKKGAILKRTFFH